jgi:excisionase family DNA binding protein
METKDEDMNILHSPRLLEPREVADTLSISVGFVYKLVQLGELSAVRIGTSVRISPTALREFMEKNRTR